MGLGLRRGLHTKQLPKGSVVTDHRAVSRVIHVALKSYEIYTRGGVREGLLILKPTVTSSRRKIYYSEVFFFNNFFLNVRGKVFIQT